MASYVVKHSDGTYLTMAGLASVWTRFQRDAARFAYRGRANTACIGSRFTLVVRLIPKCTVHGGIRHGKEAEDLRSGIEDIIAGADDSVDRDARVVSAQDLQDLLDKTDARDSLAYIEKSQLTISGSDVDRAYLKMKRTSKKKGKR